MTVDHTARTIRATPAYRNAVRCARIANLVGLPIVAWALAGFGGIVPDQPTWVFLAGWAAITTMLVATWAFLFRAGLPLFRVGDDERKVCQTVLTAMMRDIVRPMPRDRRL